MFKNHTAAELASAVDTVQRQNPIYAGALSQLDEATSYWAARYPQLAEAHRAFATARHSHWPHSDLDGWLRVQQAAQELADLLRPFGDARLSFCSERGNFDGLGMDCTGVLGENGECRYRANHIDHQAKP